MEVPFRLARRATAPAADAVLLFAADAGPLAAACARLGALPEVFPVVRGGFLLVPRAAEARPVPGSIRLRRLAGDLFVPADADLVPALLPEEAAGLTRERGLIVLAGGTVLAFDATAPLPVGRWLAPAEVRRAEWRAFPARPDRPDTLTVIERPSPTVATVFEVLGDGAPDDTRPLPGPGEGAGGAVPEDARPPAGSLLGRAAAGAGLATAGFLAWLGQRLGAAGLARIAGDLARRALERAPRLSEKLFGDQEAALREVLRQLQSGDVEKGLQRVAGRRPRPGPAGRDRDGRPARPPRPAVLAPRPGRVRRGCRGGLAGRRRRVGGTGPRVPPARRAGFARAATTAAPRTCTGCCSATFGAAANALVTGGLFRDAALLFRDRLNDPRAAADAFDRAGDHDEALRLYDRLGEYERAAELLRRLGDEARAVGYYVRAADRLVAAFRFLVAGDLLRTKAHRRDLALAVYRAGWRNTASAESVTCAERLIDEHRGATDRGAFEALVGEAELVLAPRPRDAGRLLNYALRAADGFLPPDARADLADRVRLTFAAHLRAYATIGGAAALVGELFPTDRPWPPPVGRDAAFAARGPRESNAAPEAVPRHETGHEPDRRLVAGPVTGVVAVRGTFDVVVAGAGGIVCWRVSEGTVVAVAAPGERVTALSASAQGDVVYAIVTGEGHPGWLLRCYATERGPAFQPMGLYTLPPDGGDGSAIYLQSAAELHLGQHRVAVATLTERMAFIGRYLGTPRRNRSPTVSRCAYWWKPAGTHGNGWGNTSGIECQAPNRVRRVERAVDAGHAGGLAHARAGRAGGRGGGRRRVRALGGVRRPRPGPARHAKRVRRGWRRLLGRLLGRTGHGRGSHHRRRGPLASRHRGRADRRGGGGGRRSGPHLRADRPTGPERGRRGVRRRLRDPPPPAVNGADARLCIAAPVPARSGGPITTPVNARRSRHLPGAMVITVGMVLLMTVTGVLSLGSVGGGSQRSRKRTIGPLGFTNPGRSSSISPIVKVIRPSVPGSTTFGINRVTVTRPTV